VAGFGERACGLPGANPGYQKEQRRAIPLLRWGLGEGGDCGGLLFLRLVHPVRVSFISVQQINEVKAIIRKHG